MNRIGGIFYLAICVAIAMVGYHIHGSIFWSIVDFFLCPLALAKWVFCHQITLSVLKATFGWFWS